MSDAGFDTMQEHVDRLNRLIEEERRRHRKLVRQIQEALDTHSAYEPEPVNNLGD